jgi:cytochrome oxidase assembly protein ShyY1
VFGFLASRRWALRILAGLVLVAAFVRLGLWQLDRNDQREARNAVVEANAHRDPVPVEDVLTAGVPVPADQVWTPVEAAGRYDVDHQMVVRLRPLEGRPGVHVLTPLVTDTGTAVLVDRGFVAQGGSAASVPAVPEPPAGDVEVVGRIRPSEDGRGTGGDPGDGVIRYVDVDEIAQALPYPLFGAWLELVSEVPAPAEAPVPPPAPSTDAGPHLSYAVQWFLFACIGIGGFVFLVRAESRILRDSGQGSRDRERSQVGSGT